MTICFAVISTGVVREFVTSIRAEDAMLRIKVLLSLIYVWTVNQEQRACHVNGERL